MKTKHIKIRNRTARKLPRILAAYIAAFLGLGGLAQGQDQFWDGSNTQPNNMVDGGSGTWDSTTTNWTTASGGTNSSWLNGMAVFGGLTPGIVTVTQPIFFAGLEFMTSGYQIDQGIAGSLNLIGSPTITTDPGVTATINATLAGAGGITKEGLGTLVLSGANTYFGSTAINAGTLSISSDANLGTPPSTVVPDQLTFDNGATLQATASFAVNPNRGITLLGGGGTIDVTGANTLSYAGSISGTGNLTKVGTGTQILRGQNFYTGTTFVNDGTLTLVSSGGSTLHHIIIGPLIIGDDVGAPNTATVMDGIILGLQPKIANSIPVTVNSDGLFVVNVGIPSLGQGEAVRSLVINRGNVIVEGSLNIHSFLEMNGGSISGAGAIGFLPDVTATSDASGNAATISANAKLPDASRVLTVNDGPGSTDLLISGVIFQETVPVGITKEGTGTLVLSGANTYTGITTINAGVLSISSFANLGTAPGAPVPNQLTFNGGTLQVTAEINFPNPNRGITLLSGGGTIAVTAGNGLLYGGVITGAGSLTKTDTGVLQLDGPNTYTGATTVNGGTLRLLVSTLPSQTALTVATGATVLLGGPFQSIGSLAGAGTVILQVADLTTGNDHTSTDFSGVIQGSGLFLGENLIKVGTGTQTLSGDNTYTGGTTISTGTLQLGNGGTSGSIVGDVVNNATFAVNRSDTFTFGGVISGTGAFQQLGTGTTVLTGANTYTGATTVNGGTLAAGAINTLPSGTALAVATGATFDLNNFIQSIGSLAGAGSVTLGTATLTAGNNNTGTDFSGVISGLGGLTKVGTGTQTLSGNNTYSGPTMVDAGSLLVDGSLAAASAVTVNSGATLGGTGTAAGAVTIANGGILAPGNSPGTLTVGSLSLSNASLLNYELGTPGVIGSGANDLTIVNGNLTLDGVLNTTPLVGFGPGAYRLFNYGGALTDNTLDIGTVPPGFSASNLIVVTGVPNEVDLLVIAGPPLASVQFWDGPNMVANITEGGSGDWDNFTTNWTDASGGTNSSWLNGVAVFAGTAGTVTVTQPIFFAGLEFMTSGYQIDQGIAGSLNLIGSPTITTDPGVTATINATLAGAGGITKEGLGTLVLSGANTYLGITAINAGVLSISSDANLGTAPGAPVADQLTFNGGTLRATASFDLAANRGITLLGGSGTIGVTGDNILSYGGVITGAGSLTKTDTGTLQLFGINTYTGATTVNGGTLAAGAINTLPSQTALTVATGAIFHLNNFSQSIGSLAGTGSVTLGTATLTTGNNNTSTDFSGVVSGLGGLTKVGTGTQTLSGDNTYSGGTTISTGTLQLGNGGTSGSIVGDVVNNATFAVNRSDTFTFGGVISGAGAFQQLGTGTTVLTGAKTFAGATAVNGGSLIVDGSIASAQTFINAGGLLGGQGFLGGSLTNSGIVSPGNSPGTLTVNGNYTQNANGTLRIEVAGTAPGQFDLLAVGGHASLAGTLQLVSLGNFQLQVGDKATFLTAQGGVSGTFSTIQSPFVLINAQIIYLPTAVQLEGTQGSFTAVACNPNTLAVANALDSAVGDPRASGLIEFLDTQPLSELCGDLELIAPDELPAMFNIGVSLASIQTVNLERRMEDIRAGSSGFSAKGFSIDSRVPDFSPGLAGPTGPEGKSGPSVMQPTPENRWGVFVTGLGEFTDVDSTSIVPGYNFSTGGLTFGADYRLSPNFAIGLTGGYAHTNADLVNNGSLDVNGGTIGAYATGFAGGFYVNAAAFGVFNGYDSHRTALLGTASGNTDGQDFNALAMAGYDWKRGDLTVGPLASFQYTYVGLDSFTEHGSLAPLSFSNQNAESTRTALGAKASYEWHVGHVVVKPEIRASWQHEFGDTEYSIVSRFASGAGNSFTVNGSAIGRDSLLIGAGAAVLLNDRVSVYAYYDGELARTNYSSNNVSAGLRFTF